MAASGAAPDAAAAATAREGEGATGGPPPASPHPARRSLASAHRCPPTAGPCARGGRGLADGRRAGSGGGGWHRPRPTRVSPPSALPHSATARSTSSPLPQSSAWGFPLPARPPPPPAPPLPTALRALRGRPASSALAPSATERGIPTLRCPQPLGGLQGVERCSPSSPPSGRRPPILE